MSVPLKETVIIGPFLRPYAQRLAQGFAADDQDMAMHEARLLLNLVLNGPAPDAAMLYLHDNIEITSTQRAALDQLITDRLAGKPISRMRGWREFFGYLFYLNEATLDPRPDSEILIKQHFARRLLRHRRLSKCWIWGQGQAVCCSAFWQKSKKQAKR